MTCQELKNVLSAYILPKGNREYFTIDDPTDIEIRHDGFNFPTLDRKKIIITIGWIMKNVPDAESLISAYHAKLLGVTP